MQYRITAARLGGVMCALALAAAPIAAHAADADQPTEAHLEAEAKANKDAEALFQKAIDTAMAKGIAALKPQIPALSKALDDAPPVRRTITIDADALHTMDANAFTQMLLAQATKPQPRTVYPDIALIVGSYHVEIGEMETALTALDKGLAMDPGNTLLIGEKGVALSAMRRFADAVAAFDEGIAANNGRPQDMARLHRGRGVALIDLNRLDEAEAALKTSLELQPNHPVALNELKYIAQIRAGAANNKPYEVMTSEEAARQPLQ